jgi:microcystin-dependent protein
LSQPYLGEIRMFGGNFPPAGWAFCDGAQIAIAENETLFNLIGTTYGGDGQNTFQLPDLRGRIVTHMGTSGGTTYILGQAAGVETVTLTANQLPSHSHPLIASTAVGDTGTPTASTMLATGGPTGTSLMEYGAYGGTQNVSSSASTTSSGGSQSHDNMQPYLGVNFIISLNGIYPSQN